VAKVSDSVLVHASLAETWDHYFDPRGWTLWVDGFAAVETSDRYPQEGSTLVWRSTPAGRGTVSERVLVHEPRRLHHIAFSDPESHGELLTRFAVEGSGTRVAVELSYGLARGGPLAAITERLFVRGQVRGSVRRTLERFKHEVEELAEVSA
jgi:uncharacterized membrane protein